MQLGAYALAFSKPQVQLQLTEFRTKTITKLALLSKQFCAPKCSKTHVRASRISKKKISGVGLPDKGIGEGKRGKERGT